MCPFRDSAERRRTFRKHYERRGLTFSRSAYCSFPRFPDSECVSQSCGSPRKTPNTHLQIGTFLLSRELRDFML